MQENLFLEFSLKYDCELFRLGNHVCFIETDDKDGMELGESRYYLITNQGDLYQIYKRTGICDFFYFHHVPSAVKTFFFKTVKFMNGRHEYFDKNRIPVYIKKNEISRYKWRRILYFIGRLF